MVSTDLNIHRRPPPTRRDLTSAKPAPLYESKHYLPATLHHAYCQPTQYETELAYTIHRLTASDNYQSQMALRAQGPEDISGTGNEVRRSSKKDGKVMGDGGGRKKGGMRFKPEPTELYMQSTKFKLRDVLYQTERSRAHSGRPVPPQNLKLLRHFPISAAYSRLPPIHVCTAQKLWIKGDYEGAICAVNLDFIVPKFYGSRGSRLCSSSCQCN